LAFAAAVANNGSSTNAKLSFAGRCGRKKDVGEFSVMGEVGLEARGDLGDVGRDDLSDFVVDR